MNPVDEMRYGVKQGCALAPTLFSLIFSAMLTVAFSDEGVGLGIRYRTDGSVFNLRRLQAKTMVLNDTINDFLFADDCAVNADTENGMQHSVDLFSNACDNFGLTFGLNFGLCRLPWQHTFQKCRKDRPERTGPLILQNLLHTFSLLSSTLQSANWLHQSSDDPRNKTPKSKI